jgi:hypothetical protein
MVDANARHVPQADEFRGFKPDAAVYDDLS